MWKLNFGGVYCQVRKHGKGTADFDSKGKQRQALLALQANIREEVMRLSFLERSLRHYALPHASHVVVKRSRQGSCLLRIVRRNVNIVRGRQAPDRDLLPSLSYLIAGAIVVTLRSLSVAGIVDLILGLGCAPALNRVLGSH